MCLKKHVPNLLIIIPIILIAYVYAPLLMVQFNYLIGVQAQEATTEAIENESFQIFIPRLGIKENITENVDPFNKEGYMDALSNGVAHSKTSLTPDKEGTTYLFAHSSDNPFSAAQYNISFSLLPKLESKDEIIITYNSTTYTYRVNRMEIVSPTEVEVLLDSVKDQLILQTCTFPDTSRRILVFADRVTS